MTDERLEPAYLSDVLDGFARMLDVAGFGVYSPDSVFESTMEDPAVAPILIQATDPGLFVAVAPTTTTDDGASGVTLVGVQVRSAHLTADRLEGFRFHDRLYRAINRRTHFQLGSTRISVVRRTGAPALLDEDNDRYQVTSVYSFTCNPA